MAESFRTDNTRAAACTMLTKEHKASYNSNSTPQRLLLQQCRPALEKAIADHQATMREKQKAGDLCAECIWNTEKHRCGDAVEKAFADMGCASGPNCWTNMQFIIDCVKKHRSRRVITAGERRSAAEVYDSPIQYFFCDLPLNDFNDLLSEKEKYMGGREDCFVAAVAGNIHGRLFPPSSVQMVFSSTALHWLSESPDLLSEPQAMNLMKKKIWVDGSHVYKDLKKVYVERWTEEFEAFLTSREKEMVNGGLMFLLIITCNESSPLQMQESCFQLFEESWIQLVEEGILTHSQLETFNIPWHFPTVAELESTIKRVPNLKVQHLDEVDVNAGDNYWKQWSHNPLELARRLTNFYKSISWNFVENHVGSIRCESIFSRFNKLLERHRQSQFTWDPYWIYPWSHYAKVEIIKKL
ncbi:hypothetical protein KP509_07G012000 [Ceratopteris richardii]|uniref:Uncharacterized protein n=1 Tax=Ceratopteris richardii TaxID=49495 RepID=A0A8T2UBZ2_CERRI|nr:hypothetical protein KP509_07G012000 [Ceratopteris richardii]